MSFFAKNIDTAAFYLNPRTLRNNEILGKASNPFKKLEVHVISRTKSICCTSYFKLPTW